MQSSSVCRLLTCLSALTTGELSDEQNVLAWLIKQRTTDTIEEVTDEILDDLIANFEYVVVYFSKYVQLPYYIHDEHLYGDTKNILALYMHIPL